MPRLVFAPDACLDLYGIWEYVAADSPERARKIVARLSEGIEHIATFPGMGRERPELAPGLRSFPIKPFVVFYRSLAEGDGIEVARVLRQERDGGDLFSE
jgi:toxin ParE1/3/4